MAFTVYQHINKIDGKRYVGITAVEPKRRWRPDGSGYKSCPRFWRAIQEIGWDNFEHEIVAEELTEAEASEMEIALIKQYKSDHNVSCCDTRASSTLFGTTKRNNAW